MRTMLGASEQRMRLRKRAVAAQEAEAGRDCMNQADDAGIVRGCALRLRIAADQPCATVAILHKVERS
jgi:hypothetical protein